MKQNIVTHKLDKKSPIMKTGPHDKSKLTPHHNEKHPKEQDHAHLKSSHKGLDAGNLGKPWHKAFKDTDEDGE